MLDGLFLPADIKAAGTISAGPQEVMRRIYRIDSTELLSRFLEWCIKKGTGSRKTHVPKQTQDVGIFYIFLT
jgi:hypothetical protein